MMHCWIVLPAVWRRAALIRLGCLLMMLVVMIAWHLMSLTSSNNMIVMFIQ